MRRRRRWLGGSCSGEQAVLVLLIFLVALISPAAAQERDNRAGLIVQFGDGSLHTACVDLGTDGQATGEEVLRASGLGAIIDYGSGFGGGTVCKIGSEGCDFPGEACFCQCTMKPGTSCVYWSYFHLSDGQWRYAIQGASIYTVEAGDVEGWAWGLGGTAAAAQPPAIPFDQICGARPVAPPEPIPLPSSAAPEPEPTPTATSAPTATLVPSATASSTPTQAPSATPSSLHGPSTTARSSATPTATNTAMPSGTPTTTATLAPTRTATATPTPPMVVAGIAREESEPTQTASPALSSPTTEGSGAGAASNYWVFGILFLFLVGGLVVLRFGRRQ